MLKDIHHWLCVVFHFLKLCACWRGDVDGRIVEISSHFLVELFLIVVLFLLASCSNLFLRCAPLGSHTNQTYRKDLIKDECIIFFIFGKSLLN